MIDQGLLEEARQMYDYRNYNALQTVGYRELFDYFENKTTFEEAIELIKRNTRRFAKRQMTWFRKMNPDFWLNLSEYSTSEAIEFIISKLNINQ
jgi:tRNA dimethylallyltransferase